MQFPNFSSRPSHEIVKLYRPVQFHQMEFHFIFPIFILLHFLQVYVSISMLLTEKAVQELRRKDGNNFIVGNFIYVLNVKTC
jgi:hypothetical protein